MTRIHTLSGEHLEETLEDLLDEVVTSITNEYPEAKVILFGSYARGDYTTDSDLDFCVLVPTLWDRRIEVTTDIGCTLRSNFPLPKDIITYTFQEFDMLSEKPFELPYAIKKEGRLLNT